MPTRLEKTPQAERSVTLRSYDSFRKIAPLWAKLEGWQDNPTLHPAWLEALEETGCASEEHGWVPFHLALFEGDELLAAAPTYLKLNSEGEFIFDWGIARAAPRFGVEFYPKLLTAVPFTPATGPRLLVARGVERQQARIVFASSLATLLDKLGVSGANVLFLPEDDAEPLGRMGMLHRTTLQYHFHNPGYASLDDFLKSMPTKRRTQIRREMKAPAQQGLSIETLGKDKMSPALADTAYELYLTTVDKFTWGRRYLNRAFFETITDTMRDRVELVAARDASNKILAGAFNLRGDRVLYGRYWGTHVDLPFLHFNVCFYHSIARCIADGISTFEPGAGGEHKRARGFVPTITHSVHLFGDPRLTRAVAQFFEQEREAVEAEVAGGDQADS